MSANNGAINNFASAGKRKLDDGCQFGSCSKKSALELFPTRPQQEEFIDDSQFLALNLCTNKNNGGGQDQTSSQNNSRPLTNLLVDDDYPNQDDGILLNNIRAPLEVHDDPFEKLFRSQYASMRDTFEKYFENKYSDILRQQEETAAKRIEEKYMEMAELRSRLNYYQEKAAALNTEVEVLNDDIDNKTVELTKIRIRNEELEEKIAHNRSETQVWKQKAEKAEDLLWNSTFRPRRPHSTNGDQEGTASSNVV